MTLQELIELEIRIAEIRIEQAIRLDDRFLEIVNCYVRDLLKQMIENE